MADEDNEKSFRKGTFNKKTKDPTEDKRKVKRGAKPSRPAASAGSNAPKADPLKPAPPHKKIKKGGIQKNSILQNVSGKLRVDQEKIAFDALTAAVLEQFKGQDPRHEVLLSTLASLAKVKDIVKNLPKILGSLSAAEMLKQQPQQAAGAGQDHPTPKVPAGLRVRNDRKHPKFLGLKWWLNKAPQFSVGRTEGTKGDVVCVTLSNPKCLMRHLIAIFLRAGD